MEIQLTEDVKEWIGAKGKVVTLKTIEVNGCCAPGVQELFTHFEKPKDMQNYYVFKEGELTIYVQKQLTSSPIITLYVSGFSVFKTISAKLGS